MGRRGGFTLLEVLVALAVLVLVGGMALQAFGGGLRGARVAEDTTRAIVVAESLLASVGADYPEKKGTVEGVAEGGLAWTLAIEPLPDADQPSVRVLVHVVTVTVTWGARPSNRSVALSSFALGPRP